MKRILCIDGGGMRGYLPAAVLIRLEEITGRRCGEMFDEIWGTSIGGIVAGLLGSGVPASETLKFFTQDGPHIFRKRPGYYLGVFGPRYRAEVIEGVLRKRFEGRSPEARIGMTAFDLVTQRPYFFKFFPGSKDGARTLRGDAKLWEAARATSSAQIYFPAFQRNFTDGHHVFWDGGNVANNPAVCAFAESLSAAGRYPGDGRIMMLSLGCGAARLASLTKRRRSAAAMINAPAWRNGLVTLGTLFESGSEEVDFQMKQFLGENYIRVQPTLDMDLPIDGASPPALTNLADAAANAVRYAEPFLRRFLTRAGLQASVLP